MEAVSKMWEAFDDIKKSASGLPAKAYARKLFIDTLEKASQKAPTEETYSQNHGMLSKFAGMPIHLTENLPQGVLCMIVDKDNKPLTMMTDDTYVSPDANQQSI